MSTDGSTTSLRHSTPRRPSPLADATRSTVIRQSPSRSRHELGGRPGQASPRRRSDPIRFRDPTWSQAARNRDFIVHHYDRIDPDALWVTVSRSFPRFERCSIAFAADPPYASARPSRRIRRADGAGREPREPAKVAR
ncbi:HepT-like ribonuclease domain-containing protein [Agromyces sp. NPDC056523]|uniref:HepT-like ribonuclease domain-containing protein n=1 Tax=Agromyces sp. NPDC056523 TaxID=3345850 RepID=UPI0036710B1C